HQVYFLSRRIGHHMRIFPARLSLAQVVETKIGDDAEDPCVERTFEAEAADVTISLEEGFLVNVLGISFRVGEAKGEAKNGLIVLPDERLKSSTVTALRGTNQITVIQSALSLTHSRSRWLGVDFSTAHTYRCPDDCCLGRHLLCP